jgi:hypothetical protein
MTTCSSPVIILNCCKPKQVFNTYKDIVNDYNKQYKEGQECYYKWYSKADTLGSAVKKAFRSEDKAGNVNSHQCRVGRERLKQAANIATEKLSNNDFADFNEIYNFVKKVAQEVDGFGALATYDVAIRISKYCKIEVNEVYFHAGTTKGAIAIGINAKDGESMMIDNFPHPFNTLSGDHLENLFCIYKDNLKILSKI